MNIQEAIVEVMMKDKQESITDTNNITDDRLSHSYSSQRENVSAIFILLSPTIINRIDEKTSFNLKCTNILNNYDNINMY